MSGCAVLVAERKSPGHVIRIVRLFFTTVMMFVFIILGEFFFHLILFYLSQGIITEVDLKKPNYI